jgi:hypothetical protein
VRPIGDFDFKFQPSVDPKVVREFATARSRRQDRTPDI